jgi:hypothetical protein
MAWVESHRGSFRVRYRLDDGTIFTEHGYASDEGLIGSDPCRKLWISFEERPERPHAATDEVDALAERMSRTTG